ncbi:MAG: hypothetical protein V4493_07290 [Pseudomonadota bacterium]
MNKTQKNIALTLGSAFVFSVATTTVSAEVNPFSVKSLSSGYQVADADVKMKDGKCSAGKCGANKKMAKEKIAAEKAKEGSCSAEKMKNGSCSAKMKKEAEEKLNENPAK